MGLKNAKTLEELGFELIEIEKLVHADWNYKEEDPVLMEKLKGNMKRNGVVENLIIRELDTGFFEVVNGNHRLDAMKSLGLPMVPVYNKGKITTAEAQRIAIETNETRFKSDQIKLAELLKEISGTYDAEDLAQTLAFSQEEIEDQIKMLDFDFEDYEQEPEEGLGAGRNKAGEFDNKIEIEVSKETFELWKQWCERCKVSLGYDNDSKAFEFAIVEAMNMPMEEDNKEEENKEEQDVSEQDN